MNKQKLPALISLLLMFSLVLSMAPAHAEKPEPIQISVSLNGQERMGSYTGPLSDGLPEGQGVLITADDLPALSYEGGWKKGQPFGSGTMEAAQWKVCFQTPEGEASETGAYRGMTYNGLPHGEGMFIAQTGGLNWSYDGQWKDGRPDGQGREQWENGFVRIGTFTQGLFTPTWSELILTFAEPYYGGGYRVGPLNKAFLDAYGEEAFAASPDEKALSDDLIHDFSYANFAADPSSFTATLGSFSGARILSVQPCERWGLIWEELLLQGPDGILYRGCLNGRSGYNEGMIVRGHFLPLDIVSLPEKEEQQAVQCVFAHDLSGDYAPLSRGDEGEAVLQMKQRLQQLGYFSGDALLSPRYNSTCEERVLAFQRINKLPPTGNADEATLTLLYSNTALPKP